MIIIDEQHRFGVEQREALRAKAVSGRPHVLVMTATPIPRTVAMTVFGDLEVTELTELPAGRSPIATHVVPVDEKPHYLARTWERVKRGGRGRAAGLRRLPEDRRGEGDGQEDTTRGRRPGPDDLTAGTAGSVVPMGLMRLVGRVGSAGLGCRAGMDLLPTAGSTLTSPGIRAAPGTRAALRTPARATRRRTERRPAVAVIDMAAELASGPLADVRLCVLHGKLALPTKRTRSCSLSPAGKIDVLVTTTVIEVGVDVPNATTMVIMDADRFGVSQLHQLRGRVGRGGHARAVPAGHRRGGQGQPGSGSTPWRRPATDSSYPARPRQRKEGDVLGSAQAGRRSTQTAEVAERRGPDRAAQKGGDRASRGHDPCWPGSPLWPRRSRRCWTSSALSYLEKA